MADDPIPEITTPEITAEDIEIARQASKAARAFLAISAVAHRAQSVREDLLVRERELTALLAVIETRQAERQAVDREIDELRATRATALRQWEQTQREIKEQQRALTDLAAKHEADLHLQMARALQEHQAALREMDQDYATKRRMWEDQLGERVAQGEAQLDALTQKIQAATAHAKSLAAQLSR